MHPVEAYLKEMNRIRATGGYVPELSFYGPLATLINAVGEELSPPVHCINQVADTGAGHPDAGLYADDQLQDAGGQEPLPGQIPARGVIEVKSPATATQATRTGEQVERYWSRYRQVLVTNYRQFVLIGQDERGDTARLETYSLAETEEEFWDQCRHPRRTANHQGDRLLGFLRRVLLRPARLSKPEDVAWFLASYAREALARIEGSDLPALQTLRKALEQALGMEFRGDRGEHFFESTLIQTLFYGVFSAWVLWSREHPPSDTDARFQWELSAHHLRVPVMRKLFHEAADPGQLDALGISEVLQWGVSALNRVDRAEFFSAFEQEHAVQYFYEPFLENYDPELRKQLGVWYTPPEIVRYMVARVDRMLEDELGIEDGLADENVYVLDPCCGTGAYLVEVLERIRGRLEEGGDDALIPNDLKRAAKDRVFGFEILPAPYVVSHLQLGLRLQDLGVPLADEERVGVYLTNSLTGWKPPEGPKQRLLWRELQEEREAADDVKRNTPLLVILGNPPYNGYAGVAVEEERELSEAYRTTSEAPKPRGQGLNDLYVRFYRMAERHIVENQGRGIVCYISNYSWLDGLSFTGMRERYLEEFDRIWIDCLNGDKYKTGKVTPWGEPDPSVFSTEFNREGIQVGTAIGLMVRNEEHEGTETVRFRHFWGTTKRQDLVESADHDGVTPYEELEPPVEIGYPFMPATLEEGYLQWPRLPDLMPTSFPGIQTCRDGLVVDTDRDRLIERMEHYFDPEVSHEEMRDVCPRALKSTKRFHAEDVREQLQKRGFFPDRVVRYCYRPFDIRWLYWEPETKLLDEKRADYVSHVRKGNVWLGISKKSRRGFDPPVVSERHTCRHIVERGANMFPAYLYPNQRQAQLGETAARAGRESNLSPEATAYLADKLPTGEEDGSGLLFHHAVAVLHAPRYRKENRGALRQDWPRVPLPDDADTLRSSAQLGHRLADLLDPAQSVPGVTTGSIAAIYRSIGNIRHAEAAQIDPAAGELAVTAGWGYLGYRNATMPGSGHAVERDYTDAERNSLLGATDLPLDHLFDLLGESTFDIYLNDAVHWSNVPSRVWTYTLGGYQVIKKWLSYREKDVLGRDLRPEEARYITQVTRRITAILLMEPELDANYETVKSSKELDGSL